MPTVQGLTPARHTCAHSHDTDIKLWDLRKSSAPLHSLCGHHMVPKDSRIKGMHRASFFAGGRYVVTTGEKTDLLSIYDVASGIASVCVFKIVCVCVLKSVTTRGMLTPYRKHVKNTLLRLCGCHVNSNLQTLEALIPNASVQAQQ